MVVGSPIANRQQPQLEDLIGFFVNSLALRVHVHPDASFRELLSEVRAATLDAYLHQDVPVERLVEEVSPSRSLTRTPIFQVWFALQNAPRHHQSLPGIEVTPEPGDDLRLRFDLELHAVERGDVVDLHWMFKRDLFDRLRIERMARHYVNLLTQAIETPDIPLRRLSLLDRDDTETVLGAFNATTRDVPSTTMPALLDAQAVRTPDAV